MVCDRIGMPSWGRWMAALATILAGAASARAAPLELREGDHVCIIGGGLADRMQHTGWLEVRLHSRFPGHRLVIRNLAVEGDEIDPAKRLRSEDFGTRIAHDTLA